MKKEPYLRNENPDEIREVLYLEVRNLRDLVDKEDLKEIKINLENIIQRTDQINLKELILKGIENIDKDKTKYNPNKIKLTSLM